MTVSSIEGDVKMVSSMSIQDVNWYFSAKYVDTQIKCFFVLKYLDNDMIYQSDFHLTLK